MVLKVQARKEQKADVAPRKQGPLHWKCRNGTNTTGGTASAATVTIPTPAAPQALQFGGGFRLGGH